MFDFYSYAYSLSEDKLFEEIEKINKKLLNTNPNSPIYNQLLDMRDTASMAYGEILAKKRIKKEDTVLEIGTIESTEYTPDYKEDDVLNIIVQSYIKKEK